jgi:hypothetical protein
MRLDIRVTYPMIVLLLGAASAGAASVGAAAAPDESFSGASVAEGFAASGAPSPVGSGLRSGAEEAMIVVVSPVAQIDRSQTDIWPFLFDLPLARGSELGRIPG